MKQLSIRYDAEKVEPRVDALIPHVQRSNEGLRVTRSTLFILCLLEGIRRYEKHYGLATDE